MQEPNITDSKSQKPMSDAIAAAERLVSSGEFYRRLLFLEESQLARLVSGEQRFNPAKAVFLPPNVDLAGWIKQEAEERGVGVEYIDCRTVTDYDTARGFMTSLPAHPRTIVIIDRPDCLPESVNRQQIAYMLVSSWKNDDMYFTSKEGESVVVHRDEYITIVTFASDGTYPRALEGGTLGVVDWRKKPF